MEKMELKSAARSKRVKLENILLSSLAVGGAVGVALLAPNALKLLKNADPAWALKRDPRRRIRESVYRLKHKGLVEFVTEDGKKRPRLTLKGKKAIDSIWENTYVVKTPKKWDGKWRIVIFDVPEKYRATRNKIRLLVMRLGFLKLQGSVWVYPYDCEELITLMKTDLKVGRAVLYIIADTIEFDKPLRTHFMLPQE